jgi:hypothetical protein
MKKLVIALWLGFIPVVVEAQPLKIVEAHNPDIHCLFISGCVPDYSPDFRATESRTTLGGLLKTRTFHAARRSRAAGLWLYEYRLDFRDAVPRKSPVPGLEMSNCIRSVTIDFGEVISSLNYGGDAKNDEVFVITAGGGPGGGIGLRSAIKTGSRIEFVFNSAVCPSEIRGGDGSTYIWGLVSGKAPRDISAELNRAGVPTPSPILVDARGPILVP